MFEIRLFIHNIPKYRKTSSPPIYSIGGELLSLDNLFIDFNVFLCYN